MNDALREALQIGLKLAQSELALREVVSFGKDAASSIMEALADVRKIEAAIAGLPKEVAKEIYTPRCKSCVLRTACSNPNNPLCSSWAPKAEAISQQDPPYNQFGTDY